MLRNKTSIFNEKITAVIEKSEATLKAIEIFITKTRALREDNETNDNEKIDHYTEIIIDTIKSMRESLIHTATDDMQNAMKEAQIEVNKSNNILQNLSFKNLVTKSLIALNEFEETSKNAMDFISTLEKQIKETINISHLSDNLPSASIVASQKNRQEDTVSAIEDEEPKRSFSPR